MKILSVRFLNLNSLKGEHEIRFDQSPLADAGLFAITGQTGAGKTTVLDAITVGLYGLVHRHSNDKPLELMTRHTAESFSEVEFEADGTRYRSRWHIRRSRGKADGNMQPVHMELCDLADDKPFDLKPSQVPDKVAELCGLDYSQFLRSVMLSQGDFARFLKASANERSSLLEKITDTGIYSEISKSAYEKARNERLTRDQLEGRLKDSHLLPEEQRLAYVQSITDLRKEEETLQKDIDRVQQQLQWLQHLQLLQAKKQQHQEALREQEQKLAQLQPDFQKLAQHEQAHQYVGELTEIKNASSKVVEVQEQLLTLDKQVPALEAELEQTGQAAIEAGKAHQLQEEALLKLEPLLEQVTQLDHQLHTIREAYKKDKAAYVQLEEAHTQEQAQLQKKQEHLASLTQEATTIKQWLEDQQRLADLQENLHELKSTVKALQEAEQRLNRYKQEQQELQAQEQRQTLLQSQLATTLQQHTAQHQQLHTRKLEKLVQLQALLSDKTIDELEQSMQEQPRLLARSEKLLELSRQHRQQTQKQQELARLFAHQEQELSKQQVQLANIQQRHHEASERLEDLQKLVLLQQQIQKYEAARLTLQPEHPCPLCGSAHHPFVEGNYHSNVTEEEHRREQQQTLVKELTQETQALQLQVNALQQKQQTVREAQTDTAQELARLHASFSGIAPGDDIAIDETERLSQRVLAAQQALEQVERSLAQARALGRELEQINQETQQNREAHIRAEAQAAKQAQAAQHQQEQLQKLLLLVRDEQEQAQAHTEVAASFAAAYGLRYTPDTRHELVQTLEQQAAQYQQKTQALQQMREEYAQVNTEVKHLTERVQEKQQQLDTHQEALKQEHARLSDVKTAREQLFGDKLPLQERQSAQQELRLLANQAEEARAKHLQKQQELREARQRQAECTHTHQKNKSLLDTLRDGLLRVLQQKGIATIEALSQMLLGRDEADRLANLKAQTEKHLTELRKTLSDVHHELETTQAQQLTDENAESLQTAFSGKTEAQRELIGQRARTQQLLDQDAEQRAKNQALAQQLQAQQLVCNRWNQLAELIGSADGNKFSRFAQGLTLARLVELANRHLLKLNDRYRILKSAAEDLELLIVDTYQAESVRPMNTLSGGESFLVSLSLALGLSDLAGRRTQINSLFIDEGFGTLDAETLDAAITTLESLQASGKMIGIISHVEALKERISAQVRIQKKAGGVSTLDVVGW
ncbi:ATP-binding cassette family protein [Pontibacter sp. E15-1]|uniref:AAA family ATPase n=1 Tax=Pontibacter sp. E15-1 TaxID=2919918 RepID=UPI001F4F649D|nr:AAA family ATPase [Pontibacter sp. E15-1]MCJ8164538.1 ATP-binding cassette family protein [Pontibacter sp. E15-1]